VRRRSSTIWTRSSRSGRRSPTTAASCCARCSANCRGAGRGDGLRGSPRLLDRRDRDDHQRAGHHRPKPLSPRQGRPRSRISRAEMGGALGRGP
jgi:hypothetical protein